MNRMVLVIEDNADNLRLISYAFNRSGYTVISAESGELGVELARRERPGLIIMDIMLPGIDGIEATKRIRASESGSPIPIVAMTSYAMRGDREAILAAGCSGYIEKPIDPLHVVEEIRQIIDHPQTVEAGSPAR